MLKQFVARFLVTCLFFLTFCGPAQAYYDGSELGYLDYVTINGQEFDNFDERQIVFYPEDLRDGAVIIKGLLESEKKHIPVTDLQIEITMNGGKSWKTAEGSSRWEYKFYPQIERGYDFSIRVVQRGSKIEFFDDSSLGTYVAETGTPYQLGEFLLTSAATAVENKLTGEATLALGWLGQFVPENLKKPGTDELILNVSDLEIDGKKIINGSVVFEPDFTFSYAGASFTLTSLTFTKDGASATGSIVLPEVVFPSAPEISFSDLVFSPADINTTLPLVKATYPTHNFEIISGAYGVTLALSELSVKINTAKDIPISLASLDGSILLGSGYGGVTIPDLQLIDSQLLSYGTKAASAAAALQTTGADVTETIQNLASKITIPNTDFSISDLGGSINLKDKSVSLSGAFNFPADLGGGSVSLPAATPLVLSRNGISTSVTLEFAAGTLPSLDLSGFPTSLSALSLAIVDNIPSGSLSGQVTLSNFADLPLDIAADIDRDGLNSLRMAVEKESYNFNLADFATLNLSKLAIGYDAGAFSVELDGSIVPTNELVSSLTGIGETLVFSGLTISQDSITLASDLDGWHEIAGGSAGFSGATVSLTQYGLGVENNLFWVGLKGHAAFGTSSATATARIFHDGTTSIDGIDLSNIYFALGDFFLKVKGDAIDEAGAVASNTMGAIGGLPQTLIDSLPAGVLNDAQELVVQLNNFQVDLANRSVTLGSVGYTPAEPFEVTLGPVTLSFAGITFTTSSASIDGSIDLAGLGLPVDDIPFADLYLGAAGIAGDIDLIGDIGTRTLTIIEGESGFSLKLDTLSVNVDTRKSLASMVSLKTFDGSLLFGSAYNDLEIPDLKLLADSAISWGKSSVIDAQASLARLTLPGGFAIGDLGGSIDLDSKSLSIAGTIYLPPQLNNASVTIPADQPITLSVAHGLSTGGPLVFDTGTLPNIPLAGIDTILTGLSLGIDDEVISGSLEGDLDFKQFGGLKIAVSVAFDSKYGLQDVEIDASNLNKTFNLEGFASLTLKGIRAGGLDNDNFYVELDGDITPTHALLSEYTKQVSFEGLRVYKSSLEFAGDLGGWRPLADGTIDINAASVSLKEYGVGVTGGLFWFGLKGHAEYAGNEANITATIFHDKTYDFDFGFKGLTLALGDFKLRTNAEMVDGIMSGAGFINAGFLTEYLPDNIKDPLTGEVNVSFENLGVDLDNKKITSGTVQLTFKEPLKPNLGVFAAVIRSVSFGFDGASVDGDFQLTSLAGIDVPNPPTNLSFADIELSPQGFAGSVTYNAGRSSVSLPVLTGDYGITLLLSELTVSVDTTKPDLLDKIQLTDLDGSIKLGAGYELSEDLTQLTMLADQGITWGVQQAAADLADMGEDAAKAAAKEAVTALAGLDFKIPGTEFHVNNFNGRLYLNDKKLKVWGKVQLPENLGGGSIGLTEASALVLSASGVSTSGEVDINLGSIGKFSLAGFSAEVQSFSFGVTSNSISGSLAAKIKLVQFDDIPIDVTASISNDGLSGLTVVTSDSPVGPYSLAGFADLTLTTIGGSYADGEITVILDGDLALDPTVADVARSFSFSELSFTRSSISMPNIDMPLMPASLPAFTVGDDLAQIALKKFGFTVKDNLLWIILNGDATILNQTVKGSILISHKGDINLGDFQADDLVVTFGQFTLTGALAKVGDNWSGDASLNLGALQSSVDPTILNAFGELSVSVENLKIDMDTKTLTSGEIEFAPEGGFTISHPDYFTASLPSVKVGVDGSGVFGRIGPGASISFDQGILAGYTEGLSFSDFGLARNGLQVTVTWADDVGETMTIVDHVKYGIKGKLTEIKVAFDSAKDLDSGMFVLKDIQGNLLFGTGYSMASVADDVTSLAPKIVFNSDENTYGFDASGMAFNLPGTDLQVKDFAGDISIVAQSLTLSGTLVIPYAEGKQIDIAVDKWTIDSDGFTGGVSSENVSLADIGFDATLTNASLVFDKFSIASAGLAMNLTLTEFFNLKVSASLALDSTGVAGWSLGGESNTTFTKEAPFATVTVSGLNAGYSSGSGDKSGLYFGLDSNFALKGASLLTGLPDSLVLSGIEVYDGGISIDSAVVGNSFNGVSASLAGAKIDLTSFVLGYEEQFFFTIKGGLSAGPIAADAVVTFYQNANLNLEEIATSYTEGALSFAVKLGLSESEFSGSVAVDVANTISMDGSFVLGSTETYTYWGVAFAAGGGSGVPLGALPLNLYKVGGGCAYHMTVDAETGTLNEDGNNPFVLIAKVSIGTSDATTWYGDFTLFIESSKLTLTGDSWFLTESHTGTADLKATITLGASPPLFHVQAEAKLATKLGDFTMLGVDGAVDLLFTDGDWHIWFGSYDQRLNVTALEYVTGSGYIQLSSDGLAVGVRQSFDLYGEWWIFYGSVYGGAEVSIEGGFSPFYIDASGRIWVGLEAGVLIGGDEYEIISAHAELAARFRAPNPTYLMLHGEMRYSFFSGLYSGQWEMDFVMPKGGVEGASMEADISAVPLLATTSPQDGAEGVSQAKEFEIKTALPLMQPFKYDDGQWYVLTVKSPSEINHIVDFTQQETANKGVTLNGWYSSCLGGIAGSRSLKYRYASLLGENTEYQLEATLSLRKFNRDNSVEYRGLHGTLGDFVKEEVVQVNFTTTANEPNIREIVLGSYPKQSTTPVYSNTAVHIEVGSAMARLAVLAFFTTELVDPRGEVVAGQWTSGSVVDDEQTGTHRYLFNFIPDEPLQIFHSYTNMEGEKRYASRQSENGVWLNPFLFPDTQQASEEGADADEPAQTQNAFSGGVAQQSSNFAQSTFVPKSTMQESNSSQTTIGSSDMRMESNEASQSIGLTAGMSSGVGGNHYTPYYNHQRENEYTLRIVNKADGSKVYGSKFYLTLPAEESETPVYTNSSSVVQDSSTEELNAHFYANYSINQEEYTAQTTALYEQLIENGRCNVWNRFKAGEFAGGGASENVSDLYNMVQLPLCSVSSGAWGEMRDDLDCEADAYMVDQVLNSCAPAATASQALMTQYEQQKEELSATMSTVDFRSLELRFTTKAPINWNDVEVEIELSPDFNGDLSWSLPSAVQNLYSQMCGGSVTSGASFNYKGHQISCSGPLPSHKAMTLPRLVLSKGDYVIKSRRDGLEHRLELKLNKEDVYRTGKFLRVIDAYLQHNVGIDQIGSFHIYERIVQPSATGNDFNYGRGQAIRGGQLYTIKSSRPEGSSLQSVNGQNTADDYSDICHICEQ